MKRQLNKGVFSILFVLLILLCGGGTFVIAQNSLATKDLQAVNERLKRAESLAQLGHWEIDLFENTINFSESVLVMLGLEEKYISNAEFEELLLPDFLQVRRKAQEQLIEKGVPYDLEFQIQRPLDGAILDLHSVGEYNPEANTIFGTLLNITDRKNTERALERTHERNIYVGSLFLFFQTAILIALVVNVKNKRIARAHLERNAKRNQSLLQIFHKQTDTIGELAEFVLLEAVSLTKSAGGCLCLYDDAKQTFTLEVHSASFSSLILKGQENPMLKVAKEKKPLMNNNCKQGDTTRFVLIPVTEKDVVVAVIGLADKKTDYNANDLCQVSAMMDTVWTMIDRKQKSLLLKAEKNRLQTTLLSVGDGVITTDEQGLVKMMNPAAETLTGWFAREAKGEPLEKICSIKPGVHPIRQVLSSGQKFSFSSDQMLQPRQETHFRIGGSAAPIIDDGGEIAGTVVVFRNISEKAQRLEKIAFLSHHDQLTGLHNRQSFLTRLRSLDRKEQLPFSLLMGDINELKIINNAFGYPTGDQLLRRLGDIIKENCRTEDVTARWGGDEFAILMPQAGEYEALALVRRLENIFEQEQVQSVGVSVSFGWATKTSEKEKLSSLLKRAEKSMAFAKLNRKPSVSMETVQALMSALYEKSRREEEHSQRVSELCVSLGEELGLSSKEIADLKLIGLFHDLGKISIDGDILNKAGSLTEEEWVQIRRHPKTGYRILKSIPGLDKIAQAVLTHHERWDGSGYPQGLKGKQIPYEARVVAVADSYDAMVNERSYRIPVTRREAVNEIRRCAKTHYDPEIVEAFLRLAQKEQATKGS